MQWRCSTQECSHFPEGGLFLYRKKKTFREDTRQTSKTKKSTSGFHNNGKEYKMITACWEEANQRSVQNPMKFNSPFVCDQWRALKQPWIRTRLTSCPCAGDGTMVLVESRAERFCHSPWHLPAVKGLCCPQLVWFHYTSLSCFEGTVFSCHATFHLPIHIYRQVM